MAVERYCQEKAISFTRFDYSGHGQSSGEFADGCISDWLADALTVFDQVTGGPQILVGSSMGAWIGTLLALRRAARTRGFIGVASALDFTRRLALDHLNKQQRKELQAQGETRLLSCYDNETPYIITQKLIDDGNRHLLLNRPIPLMVPVHLLHGMNDRDISWKTSVYFARWLQHSPATLTLIRQGDHRLSSPQHLTVLYQAIDAFYR